MLCLRNSIVRFTRMKKEKMTVLIPHFSQPDRIQFAPFLKHRHRCDDMEIKSKHE